MDLAKKGDFSLDVTVLVVVSNNKDDCFDFHPEAMPVQIASIRCLKRKLIFISL